MTSSPPYSGMMPMMPPVCMLGGTPLAAAAAAAPLPALGLGREGLGRRRCFSCRESSGAPRILYWLHSMLGHL